MDYEKDIQLEKATRSSENEEEGETIKRGALVGETLRAKFPFCADSISIKIMEVDQSGEYEKELALHQEVSVLRFPFLSSIIFAFEFL